MGILRLRIVIVGLLAATVTWLAWGVFDQRIWWLFAVPVIVAGLGLPLVARSWRLRLLAAVAATFGAVVLVVLGVGGDIGDIGVAITAGPQRLLSTEWPSPDRPDLIGTVAAGLALLTAIAVELAGRVRLHLSPLVPLVVAYIAIVALSAPLGPRLGWLGLFGVLSILFATLRPGGSLGERLRILRGERRLVPVALMSFAAAAAAALPLQFEDRADPRENEPAERSASLLDPIEATLALQAIDPPVDLHQIELDAADGSPPERWRTAALAEYDGRRWAPNLTLRPIGRRLAVDSGDEVDVTISFLDDDLQLVPLPGSPVTVDAGIETDDERTLVRLAERPSDGTTIVVATRVDPVQGEVSSAAIGVRPVDDTVSSLTELATELAADEDGDPGGTLLDQLQNIEGAMQDGFVLRSDATGGGLQRALIERFLRDTQRGNSEQFATAFVLLARSLGVDARVATGFVVAEQRIETEGDGVVVTLSSADAAVWPEVRVGGEWVAFDPTPAEESGDATPPPNEPQVQTPAAPQPPIAPPPESSDEPLVTETDDDLNTTEALPTLVQLTVQVAAVIGVLLVPVLLLVAIVLYVKWRRRRHRLSGTPEERILGAWSVATNQLVDAGLVIGSASTNGEIADAGEPLVDAADRELHRLATLANAATFGHPARPDLLAEDAATCLTQLEESMADSRTRWQRLRWRLSLRSLRRKTASPV